jgi:hypothetical protein
MSKYKWLFVLVLFLIPVQPVFADDPAKILGHWRLVSWETEFQGTGEREHVMGKNPTGYVLFTPEGRFWAIVTGEGREAPKTDQDRAELFKSMTAYSGMYRLEGDKFIVKVDVSGNPAYLGAEQVRFFRFDGERLIVTNEWHQSTLKPERGMSRAFFTFERAK